MVSHACTTIRTVSHYLRLMEGKKSEPSPRRSLLEWNKNRVLLILRSFHAWFVSEGGRRGRIKIVLLLRSSPSALIVSSYFSPRAADCKDTFTKGHPLLSHSDYFAWVSQWTVFVFLSPWHLSVRVSSTPTHTHSLGLGAGIAILGRLENRRTCLRDFVSSLVCPCIWPSLNFKNKKVS